MSFPIESRGCYLGKYGQMIESLPGGRGYRCNRIYGPMPPCLALCEMQRYPQRVVQIQFSEYLQKIFYYRYLIWGSVKGILRVENPVLKSFENSNWKLHMSEFAKAAYQVILVFSLIVSTPKHFLIFLLWEFLWTLILQGRYILHKQIHLRIHFASAYWGTN